MMRATIAGLMPSAFVKAYCWGRERLAYRPMGSTSSLSSDRHNMDMVRNNQWKGKPDGQPGQLRGLRVLRAAEHAG